MTITYLAPTCPPGGKCATDPAIGYHVTRHLTCHPNGGDYADPAAACRALTDIVTKLHRQQSQPGPPVMVCRCPMIAHPPTAVGYDHGKRRTIQLDACSLCNLPVGADLAVLLPGAQG